jgi:hypothetical protein
VVEAQARTERFALHVCRTEALKSKCVPSLPLLFRQHGKDRAFALAPAMSCQSVFLTYQAYVLFLIKEILLHPPRAIFASGLRPIRGFRLIPPPAPGTAVLSLLPVRPASGDWYPPCCLPEFFAACGLRLPTPLSGTLDHV